MHYAKKLLMGWCLLCFTINVFATVSSEAQVKNAYYKWCSTVSNAKGNPDAILKLYAPNAVLLATFSPEILKNSHPGFKEYFHSFTSHQNLKCTTNVLITFVKGSIAINTGFYTFSFIENDSEKVIPARFTFVYEKNHGKWLIISHHSSVVPNSH